MHLANNILKCQYAKSRGSPYRNEDIEALDNPNTESTRIRVLDLGIGLGGDYITKSSELHEARIGVDSRIFVSGDVRKYGLPAVVADASCIAKTADIKPGLPFADNSFEKIDSIFPIDSLLYGLCSSDDIWQEMKRLLIPGGAIELVFDDYGYKRQMVWVNDLPLSVSPYFDIASRAILNDLFPSFEKLTPEQVEEYGTHFSRIFAEELQQNPNYIRVYRVTIKIGK